MQTRKLGNSDLEVPAIMLGGNVFGWTVDETASFKLLDRAFELGLNFIDTADVYSRFVPGNHGGESETILGKWFKQSGKRDRVILATKVGMDMGEGKKGLAANYIKKAVEDSLSRLQTDRIDLYQSHRDDESTPIAETLGAYQELIKAGKVRFIGASNYKGARLQEAMEISAKQNLPAYVSLQPHYNLMERNDYETDLAPVVDKYKLGVIPYFALAAGFLTGKYHSPEDAKDAARARAVGKYLNDKGFAVVRALEEVAKEVNATPSAVALAWLLTKPNLTAPIASATKEKQLDDMIKATELQLDASSLKKLDEISA